MRIAGLFLLCAAAASVALAVASGKIDDKQAEAEITRLELAFARAAAAGDASALENDLADNFLALDAAGNELTKADLLARLKMPGYEVDSLRHENIRVRVFGDCAVVHAVTVLRARYQGQDVSGEYPYTRTWLRQKNRWVAVSSASLPAPPQSAESRASIEAEITRLERAFGDAITRRDAAWLAPWVADDFEATVVGGRVLNKTQALAQVASPDYEIERLENRDIRVRVFGDMAIASARGVVRGKYEGQDAGAEFRYLRIWARRNGRWQAVAAESTLIENTP
jgi:ketosteroid isomerase-like protein